MNAYSATEIFRNRIRVLRQNRFTDEQIAAILGCTLEEITRA